MKQANRLTVFVFLLVILPLTAALVFKGPDTYSEDEKRALQQFPALSAEALFDGSWTSDINTFLNDQFPLRNQLVGVKSVFELSLLKRENNDVLIAGNGQLAVRRFAAADGKLHGFGDNIPLIDEYYTDVVSYQTSSLRSLSDLLTENGVPFSVLLPPRTVDVAVNAFSYPSYWSDRLLYQLDEELVGINYISLWSQFRNRYQENEYVYYRTDHHWTTLGAYYAYAEVMNSFGIVPYSLDEFEKITLSDKFLGTTYAKSGYKLAKSDTVELFECKTSPSSLYTTEIFGKNAKKFTGFCDSSYLAGGDKYSVFIGGTNAYTRVTKEGGERETLLILKDSFANSLVPFLALHFDLEIVNLADWQNVLNTHGPFEADRVLMVYNLENVITTTNLELAKKMGRLLGLEG